MILLLCCCASPAAVVGIEKDSKCKLDQDEDGIITEVERRRYDEECRNEDERRRRTAEAAATTTLFEDNTASQQSRPAFGELTFHTLIGKTPKSSKRCAEGHVPLLSQ